MNLRALVRSDPSPLLLGTGARFPARVKSYLDARAWAYTKGPLGSMLPITLVAAVLAPNVAVKGGSARESSHADVELSVADNDALNRL